MKNEPNNITLTFLGTGTSTGVPVIACDCAVCTSENPHDKRLRTSAMITVNKKNYVFDSGPDFRYQMLREKVNDLEAIIFTHEHRDHIAGLDDIRAFNYLLNKRIKVFGTERVIKALEREFPYMFNETRYFGAPQIDVHTIENKRFEIDNGLILQPIQVWHHKDMPVMGYRISDLTYITDAKSITSSELEKVKGSRILVLNALRNSRHISHFSVSEALQIIDEINPEKAYLTHMSHFIGKHKDKEQTLPKNVHLAYDGLKVQL
ncbi:MAG: MBL fold metallo-hydrolase [Bacteroidales bacterium]|nr:MBL fold metallo-hydrolase [Bacteroidales bacterium]